MKLVRNPSCTGEFLKGDLTFFWYKILIFPIIKCLSFLGNPPPLDERATSQPVTHTYTHTHTCIHTRTRLCIHTDTHTDKHTWIHRHSKYKKYFIYILMCSFIWLTTLIPGSNGTSWNIILRLYILFHLCIRICLDLICVLVHIVIPWTWCLH